MAQKAEERRGKRSRDSGREVLRAKGRVLGSPGVWAVFVDEAAQRVFSES